MPSYCWARPGLFRKPHKWVPRVWDKFGSAQPVVDGEVCEFCGEIKP